MPAAHAQLHGRQETRSGVLEFEANGYPTDATVERLREEIDYQRAVQAYIHFIPPQSCSILFRLPLPFARAGGVERGLARRRDLVLVGLEAGPNIALAMFLAGAELRDVVLAGGRHVTSLR